MRPPQRRNSRLRDGVMSFFQRTYWPGFQLRGLFLVPALQSLARQVLEKPCSGDAAKTLCPRENLGQSDGTQDRLRNQPWSFSLCLLTLLWQYKGIRACTSQLAQDQPWLKPQCKGRAWVLCWGMGSASCPSTWRWSRATRTLHITGVENMKLQ